MAASDKIFQVALFFLSFLLLQVMTGSNSSTTSSASASASLSSSSSSSPSFPWASPGRRGVDHLPGSSSSDSNCSDCRRETIMSNRIRKMQNLQRIKHRIMSAIRSNGIDVPTDVLRLLLRPPETAVEGRIPKGHDDNHDSIDNTECAEHNRFLLFLLLLLSSSSSSDDDKVGRLKVTREGSTRKTSHSENATTSTIDVSLETHAARSPRPPGRALTDFRAASARAAGSQEWGHGSPSVSLIRKTGLKIVSFSRVLSSGKRKHVLQFQLAPAARGQHLEVVKAHLWLLLSWRPPRGHRPGLHGNQTAPGKESSGGSNETQETVSAKRSKTKRDLSGASGSNTDTVRVSDAKVKVDGSEGRRSKSRNRGRKRKGRGHLLPSTGKESSLLASPPSHSSSSSSSFGNLTSDKEMNPVDEEDNGNNDDGDRRPSTTALRVVLVSENGTRTPMTYLRTKVKATHWQQVRLPVSVIQQQLQSSNSTLTLLIRCGRGGRSVKMVLPRRKRGRGRKARRRRRKKKKERGGKGKKKRRTKRERQYRGDNEKKKKRRRKEAKNEQFRPSPFLVIDTRVKTERLVEKGSRIQP